MTLTEAERARAQRYRFGEDAESFVAARGLLRQVLAARLGVGAGEVPLVQAACGKLILVAAPPGLHFSVTHHRDLVGVALADRPIGLDVEPVASAPPPWPLVRRACASLEMARLGALAPGQQAVLFAKIWTRKEALVKAGALVDLAAAPSVSTVAPALRPRRRGTWRLYDLVLPAPYVHAAAVAVAGRHAVRAALLRP